MIRVLLLALLLGAQPRLRHVDDAAAAGDLLAAERPVDALERSAVLLHQLVDARLAASAHVVHPPAAGPPVWGSGAPSGAVR